MSEPSASDIPTGPDGPRRCHLSLGANIGPRERTIALAVEAIARTPGIRLRRLSSLYETEPVGYTDQPEFINCALEMETLLPPETLLERLRAIERELGRIERVKWHEREIDIDILLYGDLRLESPFLTIPHPEMSRRRFVLAPMAEIAPDVVHPTLGATMTELLAICPDGSHVRRIDNDPRRSRPAHDHTS